VCVCVCVCVCVFGVWGAWGTPSNCCVWSSVTLSRLRYGESFGSGCGRPFPFYKTVSGWIPNAHFLASVIVQN